MFFGLIFTTLINWLNSIICFFIFYYSRKPKTHNHVTRAFGLVWLVMGIIIFFQGLAAVFSRGKLESAVEPLFVAISVIVYILLIFCAHYLFIKVSKYQRIGYIFAGIYALGFLPFLYFFLQEELIRREITYFCLIYIFNDKTQLFFDIAYFPIFFLAIIDIFKSSRAYYKKRINDTFILLMYTASLVIAGITGYPDLVGLIIDWQVPLSRTIFLIAALLAFYSVYSNKRE